MLLPSAASPTTVNAHLRAIYPKLEVRSRSGATRFAIQHALAQAAVSHILYSNDAPRRWLAYTISHVFAPEKPS